MQFHGYPKEFTPVPGKHGITEKICHTCWKRIRRQLKSNKTKLSIDQIGDVQRLNTPAGTICAMPSCDNVKGKDGRHWGRVQGHMFCNNCARLARNRAKKGLDIMQWARKIGAPIEANCSWNACNKTYPSGTAKESGFTTYKGAPYCTSNAKLASKHAQKAKGGQSSN